MLKAIIILLSCIVVSTKSAAENEQRYDTLASSRDSFWVVPVSISSVMFVVFCTITIIAACCIKKRQHRMRMMHPAYYPPPIPQQVSYVQYSTQQNTPYYNGNNQQSVNLAFQAPASAPPSQSNPIGFRDQDQFASAPPSYDAVVSNSDSNKKY